uniref:NADH-ubiquinone oxidoreductase chain 2 n=1 Tax=Pyrrhoderma lamaoense TaxID=2282106 RepID=A0A5B9R9I5_9AGAM|nr:NADH dehydrogenase subunit 2 [Phellinus lamaoensis]QEG57151.1 NADH dehydrogenase subunit 2 [Phellinus lamaoensis]
MIFISILILIVAMAIPSLKLQLSSILLTRITSIILLYSGVLAFNTFYIQSIGSGIGIYSGLFHVTTISQQLDIFILLIGSLILIPRPGIVEHIKTTTPLGSSALIHTEILSCLGDKYSLIILFSTLGSILLLSSSDLLSVYLSIELQSFGVYILATLFKDSRAATSAGLKYFLLGGFSSCLILLGSGLVYFYTGLTNLDCIYSLISSSTNESITQGLTLGIFIIFVGFLFKVSAAPLHSWAPDVYDESPSIVTIWLTIMPKIAIFIFLLDFFIGSTSGSVLTSLATLKIGGYDALKTLLLASSLFSLLIGTIVGLAQSKIKRLFAYSTISHVGFMLLALAINSESSVESLIFYLIQYSITNLNAFLIILALGYLNFFNKFNSDTKLFRSGAYTNSKNIENIDIKLISELKGQFMSNPLLSLGLTICLFSMAGVPPFIGFFSKQMVLYSSIQNGYYFMSLVGIIVSVISGSYYLKIVRILFTEPSLLTNKPVYLLNDKTKPFVNINENYSVSYYITSLHSFVISTLTLIILLFIFKPSLLLNSTQLLSLSVFNC